MKKILCPACGGDTKRNGKTSSGATRWRCKACGASTTQRYDNEPKLLELFLRWLLSKKTQGEFGMPGRTFRHLTNKFWDLWPVAPVCDEVHHVVEVDGLWLGRDVVIMIACTEKHVIG
ncbi:type-2 histone deacetylase 1, partial [Eggerthella sp. 1_3_56FAA]